MSVLISVVRWLRQHHGVRGSFKIHRQVHQRRVLVPEMRKHQFGSCAAGIAHLRHAGRASGRRSPLIAPSVKMPILFRDWPMAAWMRATSPSYPAASLRRPFITYPTGRQPDHRFHPGAMNSGARQSRRRRRRRSALGIVAPDGRESMIQHARIRRAAYSIHLRSRPGDCRCSTATNCCASSAGRPMSR